MDLLVILAVGYLCIGLITTKVHSVMKKSRELYHEELVKFTFLWPAVWIEEIWYTLENFDIGEFFTNLCGSTLHRVIYGKPKK